ncbi:DNA cytosine methyltransferase [Acinetobacter baumannii]
MDTYGRMSWDKVAPTLTTRCYSYSNGRFGHPDIKQNRAISIREAASLQTFPENFIFEGSLGKLHVKLATQFLVKWQSNLDYLF